MDIFIPTFLMGWLGESGEIMHVRINLCFCHVMSHRLKLIISLIVIVINHFSEVQTEGSVLHALCSVSPGLHAPTGDCFLELLFTSLAWAQLSGSLGAGWGSCSTCAGPFDLHTLHLLGW